MDAELRDAIEETIERWARIATAEDPTLEYHRTHCELCKLMARRARKRRCNQFSGACPNCPADIYGDGLLCDFPWQVDGTGTREEAWAVHDFAVSLFYQDETP